jgi:methylglutaconyl-CoA hydratase
VASLRVERDGEILRITLARPERRNAFDAELIAELTEAFGNVGDERIVLLAGEGSSFSAGADVEWMRASVELDYEDNVRDARRLQDMLEAIDGCAAPVVARVQGPALGGGCGLVACSDIVVAHEEAMFAFSEVKLGIIPAVISPFVLRKIGEAHARRFFLTGERFRARTAYRIGLVSEVTDDLDEAVDHVVTELLSSGPEAARASKKLVLERPDALGTVRRTAERRTSEEGQEGLRAFLERRRPDWASGG